MSERDRRFEPGLGALEDFGRSWPQLAATDVLTRLATIAVISPALALLLRLLLVRRAGGPALTDTDLLLFFTRPAGLAGLIAAGGLTLAVLFAQQAPLMAIAYGTERGRWVSYADAFRYALPRLGAVIRLGLLLAVRLLAISAPFAVAAGLVYLALLGRHDINFYLSERPAVFWLAAGLLGLIVAALGVVLVRFLVRWAFVLPIVLFGEVAPREAFGRSRTVVAGGERTVLGWLAAWVGLGLVLSFMVTLSAGAAARVAMPGSGSSLAEVALGVALTLGVTAAANLLVSFLSVSLFALLLVRLYAGRADAASMPAGALPGRRPLSERPRWRLPGRALLWGGVAAMVGLAGLTVVLARSVEVEERVAITAHRGSSGTAPENTLAAVERAILDGADWVEIDVQETFDGRVVVIHDNDLMRVAGRRLAVWEASYEQLSGIDVGSWFAPRFADQRVPTLAQVLDLCRDRIRVNIELKSYGRGLRLVERVIELVEERGMEDQVAIMSLKRDLVTRAHALRPEWFVGFLTTVAVGDLTRLEFDFLAVSSALATSSFVRRAHRRGKQVHVWTVNDPLEMSVMVSHGVDNLITDRPRLARAVLAQRAQMTPVERLLLDIGQQVGLLADLPEASEEEDA